MIVQCGGGLIDRKRCRDAKRKREKRNKWILTYIFLLRSGRGRCPCHVSENGWPGLTRYTRAGLVGRLIWNDSRHRSWESSQPVMLRVNDSLASHCSRHSPADGIQVTTLLLACSGSFPSLPFRSDSSSNNHLCQFCADHRSVAGTIIYFQRQNTENIMMMSSRQKQEDIGCKVKPGAYEIHEDWYRCVKDRAKPV
jgi:hypothetical protein